MKRRIIAPVLITIFLCLVLGIVAGPLLAAQGRGIGAGALPAELKGVKVRDVFIPSTGKAVGVIQTIIRHVVVYREDAREAYYGAPGDRLYERDSVYTLKASRCRFKLDGEDVVTVAEDSRIGIKSFTENRARGVKNSAFSMVKGKAMFYALKLLRHRESGMTVETPTAVVGVRGTKFGTDVQEITAVHFFEGTGNVVSKIDGSAAKIGAGQSVSATPAGLGSVLPTPPAVSQQFRTDTDVPAPVSKLKAATQAAASSSEQTSAGKKEEKEDKKEQTSSGSGSEKGTSSNTETTGTGTGTGTTRTPDTSTVSQNQTTSGVTTVTDPVTDPGPNAANASGSHTGYVSGMLTNSTGSSLEEVFVSTSRQDADSNGWLRGSKDTTKDYLRFYGGGGQSSLSNPYLRWAAFDSGTEKSGDLNLAISHAQLDSQPGTTFEWGYWTEPTSFTIGSSKYLVDNRGYYLFGTNPTSAEVVNFTGTGTYSGKAYGTYWTSSGGQIMTGTFSCSVNFGTAAISAFGVNVSGGGYSALISGASGTYGSDGCFQATGGTWELTGAGAGTVTPDKQMAYGSFYTGKDYIGGAWGMYHTASNTGASGIFEGAPLPAEWKGEFTAAPRKNGTSVEIWTSQGTNPQDFNVAGSEAKDSDISDWTKITADKWTGTPIMTEVNASGAVTRTISYTEIGHNEFMAWGYWTQPTDILATDNYKFTDKGYYVYGQVTSPMPTTGSGQYKGNAYGTLATIGSSSAAENLTGTFSMDVNYVGAGQVSNYTLTAKDSNNAERVKISQTTATTLSGAGGARFDIPGASLNVTIYTAGGTGTAGTGAVRGSFYGPNASRTGGNWVANISTTPPYTQSAGGIFVGTKQ